MTEAQKVPEDKPPSQFWRIVWEAGYGWPELQYRRRVARNFTSIEGCARQLEIVQRLPSHHILVATWWGRVAWEPLSTDELESIYMSEETVEDELRPE